MYTVFINWVACLLLSGNTGADTSREARILLTDPSFQMSQLQALESKVQQLSTAYQEQQVIIKDLQSQIGIKKRYVFYKYHV